ncbi:MAG: DUF4097 family beta strand repeat-containing protein [Eubacteriales bacterium]|nr:DUF4097 family beta strand repeat-containing protein [Eubacteriales bacterium]
MKNNAIIRICIYSLLLLLLLAVLLWGLNGFSLFHHWVEGGPDSHAEYAPQRLDGTSDAATFSPAEVSALDIDWAAGDICIQKDDTDLIRIAEDSAGGAEPMSVTLKSGDLHIEYAQRRNRWFGFGSMTDKNLTITVPRDFDLSELDLDVASCNVTVSDMTIGELDFDGADGDLILEGCTIGELDFDGASGDVVFTGSLDVLDMDGASTDFEGIFTNCPAVLTMDGMSGKLDVTLPRDSGFTAKVDGMSCNFESDLPVKTQNGAYVCGDGRCKITAEGMSMDVTVRYAQ